MKVKGRAFCAPQVPISSVQIISKKMEGELMRLLQLTKEAGHSATLTFVVKGGDTLNFSLKLQRWRPIREAFNNLLFNDRIAILSMRGVGTEDGEVQMATLQSPLA